MGSIDNLVAMDGVEHCIKVFDKRIKYDIRYRFKFSRILGDSGTYKSLLCDLINRHNGGEDIIKLESDLRPFIMPIDIETAIDVLESRYKKNCLFLIDEDVRWIVDGVLNKYIENGNSYFILISRLQSDVILSYLSHNYQFIYKDGIIINTRVVV